MKIITSITNSVNQKMQIVLENNETVDFHLYYKPRTLSWYYDFTYKNLTCNGSKVVLSPNSIRQFRRILPFGFYFSSDSFVEPFRQDDFSSGRIMMAVLNSDEMALIERELYNNVKV